MNPIVHGYRSTQTTHRRMVTAAQDTRGHAVPGNVDARGGYERGLVALQQIGFEPAKDAVHVGHEMSCLLSLAQARGHIQALFCVIDHLNGLCFDVPGRLHQRFILRQRR
jgi:hypothetical protein